MGYLRMNTRFTGGGWRGQLGKLSALQAKRSNKKSWEIIWFSSCVSIWIKTNFSLRRHDILKDDTQESDKVVY